MVKKKREKVTEKELNDRFLGAIVNYLKAQHPHRFTPHDLTMPECEQMDIHLKNLDYKINFINFYNPHRWYKYYVVHHKNGEVEVIKIYNEKPSTKIKKSFL